MIWIAALDMKSYVFTSFFVLMTILNILIVERLEVRRTEML